MHVVIDNKGVTLEGKRFTFDLYFLNDDSRVLASTSGETFKNIVLEWAEVLRNITPENSPFFLPYGPDDEWTDCLESSLQKDQIVFTDVRVGREGWAIDFNDLEEFITSPQEIYETRMKFPKFGKDDVISSLINAVITED